MYSFRGTIENYNGNLIFLPREMHVDADSDVQNYGLEVFIYFSLGNFSSIQWKLSKRYRVVKYNFEDTKAGNIFVSYNFFY